MTTPSLGTFCTVTVPIGDDEVRSVGMVEGVGAPLVKVRLAQRVGGVRIVYRHQKHVKIKLRAAI